MGGALAALGDDAGAPVLELSVVVSAGMHEGFGLQHLETLVAMSKGV